MAKLSSAEGNRAWGRIVARAWSDPEFKKRLLADPESVFEENGIEVPENTHIHVQDGETPTPSAHLHLTIPPRPDDQALESTAAEAFICCSDITTAREA